MVEQFLHKAPSMFCARPFLLVIKQLFCLASVQLLNSCLLSDNMKGHYYLAATVNTINMQTHAVEQPYVPQHNNGHCWSALNI